MAKKRTKKMTSTLTEKAEATQEKLEQTPKIIGNTTLIEGVSADIHTEENHNQEATTASSLSVELEKTPVKDKKPRTKKPTSENSSTEKDKKTKEKRRTTTKKAQEKPIDENKLSKEKKSSKKEILPETTELPNPEEIIEETINLQTEDQKERLKDPVVDTTKEEMAEETVENSSVSTSSEIEKIIPLEDKTIVLKKITDIQGVEEVVVSKKKKAGFLKKLFATLIVLTIIGGLIAGGIVGNFFYKVIEKSPDASLSDFVAQESSVIYDIQGLAIAELGAYLRENVAYDDLPNAVVDAFVSIEDSRFFNHSGFDIPRFSKAIIENLKTMSFAQGGSTLTMQLIKNTYFSVDAIDDSKLAEKSIDRKIQEIYLALKLDGEMSKEEIFINYLNKLNFGGNIRGIEKGSLYYFGKSVTELNLSEAALLAGIVNRPNSYNPYDNLEAATKRRNTVLDLMLYHGYITQEENELAKAVKVEDLVSGGEQAYTNSSKQYQSYIDAVVQETITLTGKDPALTSMKIYTHMNTDVQTTIDQIQDGTIALPFPDDLMQIAIVSMDNRTGAVVGIGGGRNYEGARLLNRATSGYKQPGSSVKPFLSYALAFDYLFWSSSHVLTDRPMTYRGGSLVLKNFDGRYRGDVTIQQAFAQSLNIPAIDALQQVVDEIGREEVIRYLQQIGFSKVTDENFDISFAIGGNSFETTVMEMAGAHAMIINSGVYNQPHTIQKIILQDGTIIYPESKTVKAVSSAAAYQTAQLMRYCVEGPYFNYMQILKRKDYTVYAKTGTTDWGKDGLVYNIPRGAAKDKWMLSSTTQYTNAVWVGYDKGVKDKNTYFNSYKSSLNLPGNINSILLDTLYKNSSTPPAAIEKPSDIESVTHVLGSWPYAYSESWMPSSIVTTADIKKGYPELVSIQDSLKSLNLSNTLDGLDVRILEDGSLSVTWHAAGRCANGTKDLTLNDGRNYVPATGACILDPSIAFGSPSYYATVYIDNNPVNEISSMDGYYQGWPGEVYGSVKVCGAFSTGAGSSNTICSTP